MSDEPPLSVDICFHRKNLLRQFTIDEFVQSVHISSHEMKPIDQLTSGANHMKSFKQVNQFTSDDTVHKDQSLQSVQSLQWVQSIQPFHSVRLPQEVCHSVEQLICLQSIQFRWTWHWVLGGYWGTHLCKVWNSTIAYVPNRPWPDSRNESDDIPASASRS